MSDRHFKFKDIQSFNQFVIVIYGFVRNLELGKDIHQLPYIFNSSETFIYGISSVSLIDYETKYSMMNIIELLLKYHLMKKNKMGDDQFCIPHGFNGHDLFKLYEKICAKNPGFKNKLQDKYNECIKTGNYKPGPTSELDISFIDVKSLLEEIKDLYHKFKYDVFFSQCDVNGNPVNTSIEISVNSRCYYALIEALYLLSDIPKKAEKYFLTAILHESNSRPIVEKLGVDEATKEILINNMTIELYVYIYKKLKQDGKL